MNHLTPNGLDRIGIFFFFHVSPDLAFSLIMCVYGEKTDLHVSVEYLVDLFGIQKVLIHLPLVLC